MVEKKWERWNKKNYGKSYPAWPDYCEKKILCDQSDLKCTTVAAIHKFIHFFSIPVLIWFSFKCAWLDFRMQFRRERKIEEKHTHTHILKCSFYRYRTSDWHSITHWLCNIDRRLFQIWSCFSFWITAVSSCGNSIFFLFYLTNKHGRSNFISAITVCERNKYSFFFFFCSHHCIIDSHKDWVCFSF